MVITIQDIGWLRLAAREIGTDAIPSMIATKLKNAQLIQPDKHQRCMKITKRGQLALARLG
jgi:hypothetical protein